MMVSFAHNLNYMLFLPHTHKKKKVIFYFFFSDLCSKQLPLACVRRLCIMNQN